MPLLFHPAPPPCVKCGIKTVVLFSLIMGTARARVSSVPFCRFLLAKIFCSPESRIVLTEFDKRHQLFVF
jgi:hypothetical protein